MSDNTVAALRSGAEHLDQLAADGALSTSARETDVAAGAATLRTIAADVEARLVERGASHVRLPPNRDEADQVRAVARLIRALDG